MVKLSSSVKLTSHYFRTRCGTVPVPLGFMRQGSLGGTVIFGDLGFSLPWKSWGCCTPCQPQCTLHPKCVQSMKKDSFLSLRYIAWNLASITAAPEQDKNVDRQSCPHPHSEQEQGKGNSIFRATPAQREAFSC